jgi:hypothetical protein
MIITPNMSLFAWTSVDDDFDHTQLATNFQRADAHDHTPGKGVLLNGTTSIIPGSITSDAIADGAVGTDEIANQAITTALIADDAVTTAQLGDFSVTDDKIATGTITGDKIASLAITDANIAAATITDDKIASATITGDKMASLTIPQGVLEIGAGFAEVVFKTVNYVVPNLTSQIVYAQGNITISAPTSSAPGLVFGVVATSITSGAPVTVSMGSGDFFDIPGVGIVDHFTLGANQAYAVFIQTVGIWSLISGGTDTGWIDLALVGVSFPGGGFGVPAARLQNDTLSLRGIFENSTGSTITGGTTLFTLPTAQHPGWTQAPQLSLYNGSGYVAAELQISTSGATTCSVNLPNNSIVSLDGLALRVQ